MINVCGIDEAGRGPVIGPLVVAGVMIDEEVEQKLKALGVKDSKLLTPKKREQLFDEIIKISKYKIIIIEPKQIDEVLHDSYLNLNKLEGISIVKIINELKPEQAIIDSPSNNIKAFKEFMRPLLEFDCELKLEHKADLNYPVVAAASILAKVTRDKEIEKLKREFGDLGSGYPADPTTAEFLKKNWEKHPEIFRRSWESYKRFERQKGQKNLDNF